MGTGQELVPGSEQMGHMGLVQHSTCQVRFEADQLPYGFA